MKVLIDWRVFYAYKGGTYRTLSEILPRLSQKHDIQFGFLRRARGNPPPAVPSPLSFSLPFPTSLLPEGKLRESAWSLRLRGMKDTVFHTPYYSLPPTDSLPVVATYHDLIPELFPQENTGSLLRNLRIQKEELAHKATRIIAVSNSTKKNVCEWYKKNPEKVDVVPLGVNFDFFSAKISDEEKADFKKKWGIKEPFLLAVGGRDSHKNFLKFLECFGGSTLKDDFTLVVAGEKWTPQEAAMIKTLGISQRTLRLDYCPENDLRMLYQGCAALVFPSYYEGFGLPPLEAMAAGAPVALANVSSMPEVCGEAGHYFDPYDANSIIQVVRKAAEGGRDSQQALLGVECSKKFTWEETARLTALSYRKALNEHR